MPWTRPTPLLRIEGLVMLAAGVWLFAETDTSWWLFALLLLAPDVSMAGYAAGPASGAVTYNLGHSLPAPGVLIAWGTLADLPILVALGAIWLAHIGLDRLAGYGLKHPDAFTSTHLGPIGAGRRGETA